MGRGSGGTRSVDKTHKKKLSPEDAYYEYVHGGGIYNEKELTAMDSLFKPAPANIDLYRGATVAELDSLIKENNIKVDVYEDLEGRVLESKHYRSTTSKEGYADDYMTDIYEYIDEPDKFETPVKFIYSVSKGTPIIKRSEHTDTNGRGASDEYTLGRNVKMKVDGVYREWNDLYDTEEIEVYITVKPSKKKK